MDRIEVCSDAASDHNGTLPFFRETTFGGGKSRVDPKSDFTVNCIRLDDMLPIRGKTIAMKIDVEDHEGAVIGGMEALLRHNRCFIQVECFNYNMDAIEPRMTALGYRLLRSIDVDRYFTNF